MSFWVKLSKVGMRSYIVDKKSSGRRCGGRYQAGFWFTVGQEEIDLMEVTREALQEAKRGMGASATFIARNRFAVLDKAANQILIKNLRNEVTKKCPAPCVTTDAIFYAGTGTLLCRSEDKVRILVPSIFC